MSINEGEEPVTRQPMAMETPAAGRPFATPLMGCCVGGAKTCCYGFFCLPCMLCGIAKRQQENICTPCCPGGVVAMRTKMRVQYGIEGSIMGDCCVAQCCLCCATCQMSREADHVGL
ncbi:cornifelin-like [Lineus longissimus]|uniref:cornifelin-like n=1 Tax=Lineus longissimus TaxID=88925 RepID=UPI002B4F40DE